MSTALPARLSLRSRILTAWLLFAVLLLLYWAQLYRGHQGQLRTAETRAVLRADQTAQALAFQTERSLRKLRFIVEHLGTHWASGDAEFRQVVALARAALPTGAIERVVIADALGEVVFSSRGEEQAAQGESSLGEAAYFRAHADHAGSGFHIGRPVRDAQTGKWALPLSSALRRGQRLDWVVVVSVDVSHFAEALHHVFPDHSDAVLLLDDEGYYLSRSHGLEQVMGARVPGDRDFLRKPEMLLGNYVVVAPADGVERFYSWVRVPGFPLVLSLGLGRDKVLAPVQEALHQSHVQNLLSVLLLCAAGLGITRLVLVRARQTRHLAEARERLRQSMTAVRDGCWQWDVASGRMEWDAICEDICAPEGRKLPTRYQDWLAWLHPEERTALDATLRAHVAGAGEEPLRIECRIREGAGLPWHSIELRGRVMHTGESEKRFVGTCSDISERYRVRQMLEVERLRLLTLLEQLPVGVLLEDAQQRVVMSNKLLCSLLDLELEPADLVGLPHQELNERLHPMRAAWLTTERRDDPRRNIEVSDEILQRDLRIAWVPITRGEESLGCLWLLSDVTRRRQRERTLQRLVSTDTLTGLANRRSFLASLERYLAGAEPAPMPAAGALMMIGIDRFRRINERHGHAAGDRVLQSFAVLLQDSVRAGDQCARLGGEEFAVLLFGSGLSEAGELAERLRRGIAAHGFETDVGCSVQLTVSIGVADLADVSASAALLRASQALYAAKQEGRDRVCVAGA